MATLLLPPIGLFGGTFDPVHLGHITLATTLLQRLPLTRIQMIPCFQSPHRLLPHASSQQRLTMLQLACQPYPVLAVNPLELERATLSYTVQTLRQLRQDEPLRPWCLILSLESFAHFHHWLHWQEIVALAHLIVTDRPHHLLSKTPEITALLKARQTHDFTDIQHNLAGKIMLQTVNALDISATQIRRNVQQGQVIHGLVPPAVEQYIQQQGLYL